LGNDQDPSRPPSKKGDKETGKDHAYYENDLVQRSGYPFEQVMGIQRQKSIGF
jgi:hypothetical protein